MTSIASLEARLRRVVSQLEPEARTWVFALEPGEAIPPEAAARIRPNDRVIVQEIPVGFLSGVEQAAVEEGSE